MEILEIIKWPALILVIVFVLRTPIKELIVNIADFTITKDGLSARIGRPTNSSNHDRSGGNTYKSGTNPNEKYFSKEKEGETVFDYSNNNGVYTIGEEEFRFDTQWSKASNEYIHFYKDQPRIKTGRLFKDVSVLEDVVPERYDGSSRARTVGINQIAIFENTHGKFLAVKVLGLKDDSRGDQKDEIRFKYKILN